MSQARQTISYLRTRMREVGLQPDKRHGQNFLIDHAIIDKIVGRFDGRQTTVEIGPGQGALTEGLLQTGGNIIALELDRDLIPLLQKKFEINNIANSQMPSTANFSECPLNRLLLLPFSTFGRKF